jgi:hypothetical protein
MKRDGDDFGCISNISFEMGNGVFEKAKAIYFPDS